MAAVELEQNSQDTLWRRQVAARFGSGALVPASTNGFFYLPAVAGPPVGTPDALAGFVPCVIDSTNDQLYFYTNGTWHAVP